MTAQQLAFFVALRRTGNVRSAARKARVMERTAYAWRSDPACRRAWDEALSEAFCQTVNNQKERQHGQHDQHGQNHSLRQSDA